MSVTFYKLNVPFFKIPAFMAESGNKAVTVTSTLAEQGLCFDDETLKGKNHLKHSSLYWGLYYQDIHVSGIGAIDFQPA